MHFSIMFSLRYRYKSKNYVTKLLYTGKYLPPYIVACIYANPRPGDPVFKCRGAKIIPVKHNTAYSVYNCQCVILSTPQKTPKTLKSVTRDETLELKIGKFSTCFIIFAIYISLYVLVSDLIKTP